MLIEPVKTWLNELLSLPSVVVNRTKIGSGYDRTEFESVAYYALAMAAERYPTYCEERGFVIEKGTAISRNTAPAGLKVPCRT